MKIFLTTLILLLSLSSISSMGQTSKWKELALSDKSPYQSRGIDVALFKEIYAGLEGQQYTVKISNLTTQKQKVTGNLYAVTYCGNKLSINFNITISPGKTRGGNDYLFDDDGLTGTVQNEDCKTEKSYPNPNDKTAYRYDRIRSVGLAGITVTPIVEETAQSETAGNTRTATAGSNTQHSATANTSTASTTATSAAATRTATSGTTQQNTYAQKFQQWQNNNKQTQQIINNAFDNLKNQIQQAADQRQQAREEQDAIEKKQKEEKEQQERQEQEERRQQQEEDLRQQRIKNDLFREALDNEYKLVNEVSGESFYNKPSKADLNNPTLTSIYYVAFFRNDNNIWLMKPMKVDKYSDDTWLTEEKLKTMIAPLFPVSTYKKITEDEYQEMLQIRGYFTSLQEAANKYDNMLENSKKTGSTINIIEPKVNNNTTQSSQDFWKN